jgi:type IV secretion system protein VirD4
MSGSEPWEGVVLALLSSAIVLTGFVGLVAGVAGVVFGDGWAAGPWAELPGVVARLPHHFDDPRAAWPNPERGRLPGPIGFYATVVLISGLCLSTETVVARHLREDVRGARWARSSELRRLRIRGKAPARVTLGRVRGHLVASEPHQSTIVIAPTQSGKTTSLAIPAILDWDGPLVAMSVKSDLLRDTLAAREAAGATYVFDPAESTSLTLRSSWSPLPVCIDWGAARRVGQWMASQAGGKRGLSDADFWYSAAAKLLAPLLFAAATSGRTMEDVVRWVDTQDEAEVMDAIDASHCEPASLAFHATLVRDERQRSSIYTTAETVLEAYADPTVLGHSRAAEIDADALLDGGANTLYICGTARDQRRLRPVFVTLLEQVLDTAYAMATRRGEPLDPPLLLVLDEVANIAPLPDLDAIAATAAGHGIQLLTILQDLAQAHDRWGHERAETLVNNHRAKLFGSGLADERTLGYVTRLLGDTEVEQRSWSSAPGQRTTTRSTGHRPLAPAHRIREAPAGSALLVYGNLPPSWIGLRPWFREPRLRKLVELGQRSRSAP